MSRSRSWSWRSWPRLQPWSWVSFKVNIRPVARSGFGGVLFWWKWTFLHDFWKKVDLFAHFLEKSGPFYVLFGESRLFRVFIVCRGHVPPRKLHKKWLKIRHLQLDAEVFNPPDVFPLIPIVNKSCNIECCVNKMLQIIQNVIFLKVRPDFFLFYGLQIRRLYFLQIEIKIKSYFLGFFIAADKPK